MYKIVTLSRLPENLLKLCRSVRNAGETSEIIVADDGLPPNLDLTPFSPIRLVRCSRPFVFARNANIAINACEAADVFLINDDASFIINQANPIGLLEESSLAADAGILSAAIIGAVGNPEQQWAKSGKARELRSFACFVAVYLSRKMINQIGLLDERFDGYGYEDTDYSLRATRADLRNMVHDLCIVEHSKPSTTYRRVMHDQAEQYDRAAKLFADKWGGAYEVVLSNR